MEKAAFHWKKGLGIGSSGGIRGSVSIGIAGLLTTLERRIPELAFQNVVLAKRGTPRGEGGLECATLAGAGRTAPAPGL
jgi:hypothetical protein